MLYRYLPSLTAAHAQASGVLRNARDVHQLCELALASEDFARSLQAELLAQES